MMLFDKRGFWETIVNTAWWQVVIVLLTALVTSALTYYFADRSKRKNRLITAISQIIRYKTLLKQAWSNRLVSELNSNYYELLTNFMGSHDLKMFYLGMAKEEALLNPSQSILIGETYGKIVEQLGIIQQLSSEESYKKISRKANKVFRYKGILLDPPPKNTDTKEKASEYLNHAKKDIVKIIDSTLGKELDDLIKSLPKLKLKTF
jgi:hypothetical protein